MLFHAVKHEYSITTKNLSFIIILIIFPGVFDVLTLPSLLSKQTHPRKYVRLYVSKRSVFSVLCSSYLVSDNVSTARWRRRYFTPPFRLFIEVSVSCICNEDEASDKTQLNWCYQRQTKRDVPCFSVIVSF